MQFATKLLLEVFNLFAAVNVVEGSEDECVAGMFDQGSIYRSQLRVDFIWKICNMWFLLPFRCWWQTLIWVLRF